MNDLFIVPFESNGKSNFQTEEDLRSEKSKLRWENLLLKHTLLETISQINENDSRINDIDTLLENQEGRVA